MKSLQYKRIPTPTFAKLHLDVVESARPIPDMIMDQDGQEYRLVCMFGVFHFTEPDRTLLGQYLRRLATFVDGGGTPHSQILGGLRVDRPEPEAAE